MRIVIDVGNAMGATEREVRYTLMDALAEFQANRGPTSRAYVERRYPTMSMGWISHDEKVRQVERRKFVAEEMRNSIIQIAESPLHACVLCKSSNTKQLRNSTHYFCNDCQSDFVPAVPEIEALAVHGTSRDGKPWVSVRVEDLDRLGIKLIEPKE